MKIFSRLVTSVLIVLMLFTIGTNSIYARTTLCDPGQPGCDINGNASLGNPPPNGNASLGNPPPAGLSQAQELIQRIINLTVEFAFIALLFMLIWGGVKFIMSSGDTKNVQEAKMILTWALVGILFMIIAWLVLLMIHAFTGVDVTNFCLSFSGC